MEGHGQRSGQGMVRRLAVLLGSAALVVPLVEPVEQHAGAVARYLLTMAATAMATPVQAQTSETLVSNIDQSVAREQEIGGNLADALTGGTGRGLFVAHPFTTGRVSGGYTLTSVTLPAKEHGLVDGISITVSLHSNSSGQPGSQIAVLGTQTVPGGTSSAQNLVFNAPANTILRPNTTYFLYIQPGNLADIPVTDRTDVDNDSHFGWSMGRSLTRNYIYVSNNLWFPEDEDGYDQMNGNVRVRIEGVPILSEVTVAVVDSDTGYTEGDTVPFTLSRTGDVSNALSVAVSWDADSGLVSNDLLSQTTVTFGKNERTVTISAATIDDEVFNEAERLTLTLSAVAAATSATPAYRVGQQSSAEVEIADNDPLAVVTVVASQSSIAEGEAVTFTFSREEGVTKQVSIDVLWDAIGVTYDPRPSRTVTFPANQRTVAVTVQTADDETYSPGSRGTFGPSIFPDTNDPPSYSLGDSSLAAVSVTDNDPAPVVTLVLTPSTIAEAGGVSVVTATLDRPSSTSMNIDVSVESGAPVSLSSYRLLIVFVGTTASGDIYDAFGVLQPPVTVTARDNDVDGPDRQVLVMGSVPNRGAILNPEPVTLTITDDDLTMVSIAPVAESVSEGDAAEFRLSLTTPATEELVVDVTATGIGNVISGTAPSSVTFAEGASTATLSVPTAEDSVAEDDRTVTATVAADSDTPKTYEVGSPSEALVTVTNRDRTPPTVTSIAWQNPDASPTSATSLTWRVTFSEAVTNVEAADFTVGGGSTATVSNVEAVSGETGVYDVTVSGGDLASFTGTVTLDFASGRDIQDEAGNALAATPPPGVNANSYVVDHTAPQVVSIARQTPGTSPTNADSLTWRVTFSEAVTNVDAADFTVGGGSTATVSNVEAVSGETGVYDVTVSGGDLADRNGTVTLDFASGQDIADEVGNGLSDTPPPVANGNNYVVDNTAPQVVSITRQDPTTSPTNADSLTWRVTFSEAVTNVEAADFTVGGGSTATVASVVAVDGETGVYDVTVSGGDLATFDGTVTLAFAAGPDPDSGEEESELESMSTDPPPLPGSSQNIADEAGNGLGSPTPTETNTNSYVVDHTAPTVTAITRQTPTTSPTNANSLTWRVTFSEAVTNVDGDDFTVSSTPPMATPPTVSNVEAVDGETGVHDVTVSGGALATFDGTVTLGFAGGQDIADEVDNALSNTTPTGPNTNSYVVDNTAATLTYTAPMFLILGTAITPMVPSSTDTDIASTSATGLPNGLMIHPTTGEISGTPTTASTATSEVVVTVTDNTGNSATVRLPFPAVVQPGVSVAPPSLSPVEGETLSYSLVLDTLPAGPVTITPRRSGDSGGVSVALASMTFTAANWNTARTVSVVAMDDDNTANETVTISHSVSGYGGVTSADAVTVSVTDDDTPGVSVQLPSVSTDEGETATYTVKLVTQPAGNVTTTPTNGDSGAVSLSPARLTFTPSNWGTPQAVSVTGVQDDDANNETVTISHSVSGYGAITAAPAATVTVTDGDTAGVSVSPTSVNTDEGETATYTVKLVTLPAGNVTITPTSADSGAVSLSLARLTFTPSNWDTPRTMTVAGVQDDDANDETVTVSHSVNGYGSVTAAPAVTVSVTDGDTAGVSVSPTSVNTGEGETATYTLALDTLPAGAVTITPTSGDSGAVSLSPASLTFTASNWDTPRTVTMTGVQDDDGADETVTVSHSVSGYGAVTAAPAVTVAVMDSDTAGVRIAPTSLNLDEGGTATYTVTLSTLPFGNVTITPTSGDSGTLSVVPARLTFTASNWNTPRTVTVTGVQDDDTANETVTISHSVSGYGAVSIGAVVTISVTDDDTDGVRVTPTSLSADEAGTTTYTLQLSTEPAGAVTITPTSADSGAVSLSPANLTFTPSNWDTPRTVTVTGVQDDDTANETVTISHSVSGYGAVSIGAVVTISVTDDDTDGVRVRPTSLSADEAGTTTYTLQLSTEPADAVTITPANGDSGAVSLSPARLTFTASNWNTPRTVTVTGVQDDDANDETVTISHSVSGYGAVSIGAVVTISVTDDDTDGVRVRPTSLSADEGGTTIYTLQLSTEPADAVTITPTSADSGAVSLSPARLTFTPSNWNTPRTVSVTGVQDDDGTDETVTISHSISSYGGITSAAAVTVTVTDDGATVTGVMDDNTPRVSGTDSTADTTAPMVTSIERQAPTTSPTNADSLTWRVTFSEAVTNVDRLAFTVSGSTATVTSVQAVHGETLAHDVTISGGDLDDLNGTVTLDFAPGQTIQDQAGHPLAATTPTGTNHNSYLVDNTSMETTEPLATAWLARMGRTVAQQVLDAVANRGQADPTPGLQLSLAGEPLNAELSSLADNHGLLAKVLGFEGLASQQLAQSTGFALSPTGAAGGFSLWGEAALSGFATTDHDLSMDADLFTTLLGGDWRSGQWQVGAALAHSTGSGTYHTSPGVAHGAGDVTSRVTGLYPYAHYAVTPQFSLWGVVGHGRGEWTLAPDGVRQQDMPLTLSLAAVGMEGLLQDGGTQGFALKSNVDALWMGGSADAAADGELGEDGLDVDTVAAEVSRLRLGLQASRVFPMGDHAVITPSLEVGLRQDGGDADTGFGLDMGAGLLWQHHRHGLSAQLQGRSLLAHMAEDFSDQGLSLALSWDPTPETALGHSFSLEQTLGGTATAQVETLLGGSATAASITTNGEPSSDIANQRLELRWGYGLAAFRDAFSLTPHLAVGFSPTGRDTTLGWTLAPLGHNSSPTAAPSTTVSLEMTRREPTAHHSAGPRHSLELQLDSRF